MGTVGYSVFKRSRGGRRAARYTIVLRLADGQRREVTGFSDRGATLAHAAQLVREIERREVGLHDQFAGARATPLKQHVDAFLVSMQNGTLGRRRRRSRPTDEWVSRTQKRLVSLCDLLGATRLEQLSVAGAEQVLAEKVRTGWSTKTRDDHAALLRQFGAWLVDDGRWAANPFARLRSIHTAASKTFRRHAFTPHELGLLVDAAEQRAMQEYRASNPTARAETIEAKRRGGWERGVLYQVAAYAGLRRNEVTQLQWQDLRLGREPAIEVRAETAKNRRRARIELPAWLGSLLEQVRAGRASEIGGPPAARDRVFRSSYRHVTERLKADAVWAELGHLDRDGRVVTEAGRVLDFHALRGTLATMAAEIGMPAKHLQALMRHSDVRITMDVYAQVRSTAMRAEVERLPRPGQELNPPPAPPEGLPAAARHCQPLPAKDENRETGT